MDLNAIFFLSRERSRNTPFVAQNHTNSYIFKKTQIFPSCIELSEQVTFIVLFSTVGQKYPKFAQHIIDFGKKKAAKFDGLFGDF
jgi:hypothetical protein